jgi:hypothetical protein
VGEFASGHQPGGREQKDSEKGHPEIAIASEATPQVKRP